MVGDWDCCGVVVGVSDSIGVVVGVWDSCGVVVGLLRLLWCSGLMFGTTVVYWLVIGTPVV